jgi:hydrogenase maturation protease
MSHETLILGVGNTLLMDEGAGIHALHLLQSAYPDIGPDIPNITFLDGGTLSFTLATWIENCTSLIVFDAAQLDRPAGAVKTFVGSAMDEFLGASKRSAHEVGLLDLLDIARLSDHLPENRALIGIQPEKMDWGMTPTPAVQKALDQAVKEAVSLIKQWRKVNTDQDIPAPNHYSNDNDVASSVTGIKNHHE